MEAGTIDRQIADELDRALEKLKVPPYLLGIIGSWGDTLSDSDVLAALKAWNAGAGAIHETRNRA